MTSANFKNIQLRWYINLNIINEAALHKKNCNNIFYLKKKEIIVLIRNDNQAPISTCNLQASHDSIKNSGKYNYGIT